MNFVTNSISLQKKDCATFAAETLNKQAKKQMPAFIQQKIDAKKQKDGQPSSKKQDNKQNPFAKKEDKKDQGKGQKKQNPFAKKDDQKKQDKKQDKKQNPFAKKEQKSASAAPKFVRIAKLQASQKAQLKTYWGAIFPKEYVDFLLAD